jgi:hypothetical protein
MAKDKLNSLPDTSKFLFIAGRSGQPLTGMGDLAMDSVLGPGEKQPALEIGGLQRRNAQFYDLPNGV